MSAPCTLFPPLCKVMRFLPGLRRGMGLFLDAGFELVRPRRVFAPAGRPTFFAGAKKVGKETPNTSLFERSWPFHLTQLQRVVRSGATSIHSRVNDSFFRHRFPFSTVIPATAGIQAVFGIEGQGVRWCIPLIPAFAGMTKRRDQLWHEMLFRKSKPKTPPERQWRLTESRHHVCALASNRPSPNRLVLGVSLVTFFAPAKKVTRHAGADSRRGAARNGKVSVSPSIATS